MAKNPFAKGKESKKEEKAEAKGKGGGKFGNKMAPPFGAKGGKASCGGKSSGKKGR